MDIHETKIFIHIKHVYTQIHIPTHVQIPANGCRTSEQLPNRLLVA